MGKWQRSLVTVESDCALDLNSSSLSLSLPLAVLPLLSLLSESLPSFFFIFFFFFFFPSALLYASAHHSFPHSYPFESICRFAVSLTNDRRWCSTHAKFVVLLLHFDVLFPAILVLTQALAPEEMPRISNLFLTKELHALCVAHLLHHPQSNTRHRCVQQQ